MDVPNLKHVVNYDLPSDIEGNIECTSHTGRNGNLGLATSFFNDMDANITSELREILLEAEQEVPYWLELLAYEHQCKRILVLEQSLREECQRFEKERLG